MAFNSSAFLFFFVIVFIVYYFFIQQKTKLQNLFLMISSFVFYGIISWKALFLLLFSIIITYCIGVGINKYNQTDVKKASFLTTLGVCFGIGLLIYFKYANFFIESIVKFLNVMGFQVYIGTLNVILPVGISFYVFKLVSYFIEIHRQKIEAEKNLVTLSAYIAFFPTLLSGPIDRPNSFIPQLKKNRTFNFDLVTEGISQFAWGLFMKVCIADRIAIYNDAVFNNIIHHNGLTVLIVTLLYPLQMYTDFAGYSDMAIGIGKTLGIRVTSNFNYPFFARNIAEYWRSWHISLTGWLTDYVFMPLNVRFRDLEKWGSILSIVITFVLVGMWHGANWTFALFGFYHGILYIPLMFSGSFFKKKKIKLNLFKIPPFGDILKMITTYLTVAFGLIIFRSLSVKDLFINVSSLFKPWEKPFIHFATMGFIAIGLLILFLHDYNKCFKVWPKFLNVSHGFFVVFVVVLILLMGAFGNNQFIYFQF